MKIQTDCYALRVVKTFTCVLEKVLEERGGGSTYKSGVVISFHDPSYGPISGGYHPVEIMLSADGVIQYITDFVIVGQAPHHELVKELDFDFSCGCFQQFGYDYPIVKGRELFDLWQSNFCHYVEMDVYKISIQGAG